MHESDADLSSENIIFGRIANLIKELFMENMEHKIELDLHYRRCKIQ